MPARSESIAAPRPTRRPATTLSLVAGARGLFALLIVATSADAESPGYNRDVRPILAEYCFACHGPDSAARKADLRLDQRQAALDIGAFVPGKPEESALIARIFSENHEEVMPPAETKKTLSAEQKETLRQWIAAGAEYQPHWSFIAPARPDAPTVTQSDWVKNPIDAFILARLEQAGLSPAPEADPRALFRRLSLDITGLPPAPADVEAFVADYARDGDAALSNWIDKLMLSPAWGEHRARYWLDNARYGDTHGLHFDNYREMWPYRDWVIRSFNANQPFDQFTVDQMAGDLLPNPTDEQRIATGFQRCNITTNEGGTIPEENLALYATDRVQTFGWVYLGLTTNCCQCHDHKFDPLTMKDYYSLAAFFRNTTQGALDGNVKDGRGPVIMVPTEADRARWLALPDEITAAIARRDERRQTARAEFDQWAAVTAPDSLSSDISAEGLVVHLPLVEGTGNSVVNLAQPTLSVGTTGDLQWVADGKFGPALTPNVGASLDLGALGDFEKDQPFSYGAWIRAADAGANGAILARMDEGAAYRGWDLWQQGQSLGVHLIDSWAGNAMKVVTRDAVLKPGEWQHVFATYDGSGKIEGIKLYVGGKEQPFNAENNTIQPGASFRTTTPLRIGQRSSTQGFGGAIQDVRIYSRLLAPAEVSALVDVLPLQSILAIPAEQRTPEQSNALYEFYLVSRDSQFPALSQAVADLERERETIRGRSPVTHVQVEAGTPAMANILMRGEYDRVGDQVAAMTPGALHSFPEGAPANRLGLAQWLVDARNPLTSRVTVNRFWQQVFGRGLVVTSEDLGVMGALPSHPELLDWLAVDFRESGWDVKRFFKQIYMSNTYRQAAIATPEKVERDHDNILLSRGPRFRMDAEMIRDCALASSGLLSKQMYGPGVRPYQPENIWDIVGLPGADTREYVQDHGENLYRRTLYSFWKRMAHPPNMDAFNAPSREVCTIRRERTNTPLQALVTLNDPQFVESARKLAETALLAGGDETAVFNHMAQRVIARPLTDRERELLTADLREYEAYYTANPTDAQALITVGEAPADPSLAAPRLAAWTLIGNQIINLDEALNK
jgi:mono/diheme cytochrome c family protein